MPRVIFERFKHQDFGTVFFICTLSKNISLVVKIRKKERQLPFYYNRMTVGELKGEKIRLLDLSINDNES